MNIKLYNTLTRKEENFTPLEGNEVRIVVGQLFTVMPT